MSMPPLKYREILERLQAFSSAIYEIPVEEFALFIVELDKRARPLEKEEALVKEYNFTRFMKAVAESAIAARKLLPEPKDYSIGGDSRKVHLCKVCGEGELKATGLGPIPGKRLYQCQKCGKKTLIATEGESQR